MKILYSIVLSPFHPDFLALYPDLDCEPYTFSSERKAIQGLKSHVPDIVVADFIYKVMAIIMLALMSAILMCFSTACRNTGMTAKRLFW